MDAERQGSRGAGHFVLHSFEKSGVPHLHFVDLEKPLSWKFALESARLLIRLDW